MGFFNPIAYFIRQFFRYLRSITGKLFIIFVLLFCVLILYMCIDKGVFAESEPTTDDIVSNNMYYLVQQLVSEGNLSDSNSTSYKYLIAVEPADSNTYDVVITSPNSSLTVNSNSVSTNYGGCYYISNTTAYDSTHYFQVRGSTWGSSTIKGSLFQNSSTSFSSRIIYSNIGYGTDLNFTELNISPYIENESSTINNWSFDYLHINSGTETIYFNNALGEQTTADLYLDYVYNGIRYRFQIPSNLFSINTDDTFDIYIPRTSLLNNVNITNGSNVSFYLGIRKNTEDIYSLGDYTFSLTTDEEQQIQTDSDKAVQGEILQTQQETNNKLDNLDNSINDSSVDDNVADGIVDFADGIEINVYTGINELFESLYNAFCVSSSESVVLPIPFTDKTLTIDPNYTKQHVPQSVQNIVSIFTWGVVAFVVIKYVQDIIDGIQEGDILNGELFVEIQDIKKEAL